MVFLTNSILSWRKGLICDGHSKLIEFLVHSHTLNSLISNKEVFCLGDKLRSSAEACSQSSNNLYIFSPHNFTADLN